MTPIKILEVGSEGGRITLFGWMSDQGEWCYLRETDESALKEIMHKKDHTSMSFLSSSESVVGWNAALQILSVYPWRNFYPLFVHPEFADLVWKEIDSMGSENYSRDEWHEICRKIPSQHTVCFSHGKESGPTGVKITALASIAVNKGFNVISIDYGGEPDPDCRAKKLYCEFIPSDGINVLVGSSMGGYVATVASQHFSPDGLFLMAPAFGMTGYREQFPEPDARKISIVHGLNDDVVPFNNSVEFAAKYNAQLHMMDDGHQLIESLPFISDIFAQFLDSLMKP